MPTQVVIEDDPSCAMRRIRLWRDVVGDHMADVDLGPAGDLPISMVLRGRLRLDAYEGAVIARIDAGAQALRRTPERIRRSRSDIVFVNVVLSGDCRIEQHGRLEEIVAGGLCLYDAAFPYEIETSFDFSSLLVGIRACRLHRRIGDLGSFTGQLSPGPAARIAARYWLSLANELGELGDPSADDLIEAGLDVLTTAILAGRAATTNSGDAQVLKRARKAIRVGHVQTDFSSQDVARKAGASLRKLQSLFRSEGETVACAIRKARLETARALLADRRLKTIPIKVVMARSGFANPAHFSRAFTASFGLSPSLYREAPPAAWRGQGRRGIAFEDLESCVATACGFRPSLI